jgi:hypothetical protein
LATPEHDARDDLRFRHFPDRQQHKSVCRGYGDVAELAGEALIESQRVLVNANMETMS